MNSRRFACFLIGIWLGGGLLMAWVTTDAFRSVDRVLAHPGGESEAMLKNLGPRARTLLRYEVSEQNRAAFQDWEVIQLCFGVGVFFYLLFGTREGKWSMGLILVMLILTAGQRLFLTPELTGIGRYIDFAPANTMAGERTQFWLLHTAYGGMDAAKWVVALVLLTKLVFSNRARSEEAREKFDAVDKRNHRHVNG